MKINNITTKIFLVHGKQLCTWLGSECEGCKQYLIPVRLPDEGEPRENEWIIRPSGSHRPILQSNAGPSPGMILKLSAFDAPGKVYGRIFVKRGEPKLVSNGVGKIDDSLFEEALFIVEGEASFVVWCSSGKELNVYVDNDEVEEIETLSDLGELRGLDDKTIRKWNDAEKS